MTKKQAIDEISINAAPHKDRWHYLDFRNGKHDGYYVEWKYLNFIQGDMAGYIIYYVLDPELRTPLGSGRLIARVLYGGNFYGGVEKVPMDRMEFDTQTASVRMGGARLNEKTTHNYKISGGVAGVSWDLEYNQNMPSIDGFSDTNFGILPWEKVSWMVKMPRARVTGTISINGIPIELNTFGYSDTNWGEFVPYFSRYEWAQFNDEKISVVFGVIYRFGRVYRTYAYVEINKELINFDGATFKVIERVWGNEETTGIKTPARTRFEIKSARSAGSYMLDVAYSPVRTDVIGLKISSWLPKPSVAEQISKISGSLKRNGSIVHSFSGLGFSEYSPKTWKNVAVTL
jgi:hypothetical protein